MTPKVIPTKDELSGFVELEVHKNGGHVGFIDGSLLNPIYYLVSPEKPKISLF